VVSPSLAPPTAVPSQLTIGPPGPIDPAVGAAAFDDCNAAKRTLRAKMSAARKLNDRDNDRGEDDRALEAIHLFLFAIFPVASLLYRKLLRFFSAMVRRFLIFSLIF